jgi:formylglycine-generating enzyme required for sulfatase activity
MIIFPGICLAEEIFHPADINQDWKLTTQEFEAFNDAWRTMQNWPVGPDPIEMDDVTRGAYLVSFGEDYYFDETETGTLRWKAEIKPYTNSLGMTFVYIPPGTFMMGSPETEEGHESNETLHEVTLTKGFYMQTTEITQQQWKTIMNNNPSYWNCDNCPVERISWDDVQSFINILNKKERTSKYRLPSEAEWEYAARAGTIAPFLYEGCITSDKANYQATRPLSGCPEGTFREKTLPVASFKANKWGLFDIHGNVAEWCQDYYGIYPLEHVTDPVNSNFDGRRITRGGCWSNYAEDCRLADRLIESQDAKGNNVGARIAFYINF